MSQNRAYKQTPIVDNLVNLAIHLAPEYGNDPRQAMIAIFYAAMIEKVCFTFLLKLTKNRNKIELQPTITALDTEMV